jgi:hypothetical protein
MCSIHQVNSGIFMQLCYVSPHVICILQRVVEIVDFYVQYLVFLQDILPENGYPLERKIILLTARCSMGWQYTSKYCKFRYIYFSVSIDNPTSAFLYRMGEAEAVALSA